MRSTLPNLTVHPCCKAAPQPIDVIKFAQTLDLTTETDTAERNLMLAGGKPKSCARCWRHEELSPTTASFRRLMNFFRRDLIDGLEAPPSVEQQPRVLNLVMGSACNFKCVYCGPRLSSRWQAELKQRGPIALKQHVVTQFTPPTDRQLEEFFAAFWKYLEKVSPELFTICVTGGEPLMMPEFYELLERLHRLPIRLMMQVNTNLSPTRPELVDQALVLLSPMLAKGKLTQLLLRTSLENLSAQAEYVRSGMNFEQFQQNVERTLSWVGEHDEAYLTIGASVNSLSLLALPSYLDWFNGLERKWSRLSTTIRLVESPFFLAPWELPDELLAKVKSELLVRRQLFADREGAQVLHHDLDSIIASLSFPKRDDAMSELRDYIEELDARRGTDWKLTFPELVTTLSPSKYNA